jgi:prevent-host-death family protein
VKLSEAKTAFSAVVEDVSATGDRYVIERHGKPVAAVVPIHDLERIEGLEAIEQPAAEHPIGALVLLGAWADVDDAEIDKFLEDVYAARAEPGRPVDLGG